jgi:hypothetical protein
MTSTSRVLRLAVSGALMALAANCFLKYLWWTACYSAWSGIPKMAAQWRAAGSRATFNGWCVLVLEIVSTTIVFTVLRSRSSSRSGFLPSVARLILSFVITIALTGLFALALAWIKQAPLPLKTSLTPCRSAKIPREASWANFFSV